MYDDDFSINSTMVENFKHQQCKAAQLQADSSAKARISSLLEQMNKEAEIMQIKQSSLFEKLGD